MAPKGDCHTMLRKGAEICGVNVWHPGFWGVCARSGSVNDRPSAMGARDGAVMRCRRSASDGAICRFWAVPYRFRAEIRVFLRERMAPEVQCHTEKLL